MKQEGLLSGPKPKAGSDDVVQVCRDTLHVSRWLTTRCRNKPRIIMVIYRGLATIQLQFLQYK